MPTDPTVISGEHHPSRRITLPVASRRSRLPTVLVAVLTMVLALSACGPAAPPEGGGDRDPDQDRPIGDPVGFIYDREDVWVALEEDIDRAAPVEAYGTLRWHLVRAAFLGPNFVLAEYEDGHFAWFSLFRVNEQPGGFTFEPVVTQEARPDPPVNWDMDRDRQQGGG